MIGGTKRRWRGALAACVLAHSSGCERGLPLAGPGAPDNARTPEVAEQPMRLLTAFEYRNSVRALLGVEVPRELTFSASRGASGFDTDVDAAELTATRLAQMQQVAESVAAKAAADLPALLGCSADPDLACAQRYLHALAERAARGGPSAALRGALDGLLALGVREQGLALGVQLAIEAVLQSPSFLYRAEPAPVEATAEPSVRVSGEALATRLSFLVWGAPPDAALLESARAGLLDTPAGIDAALDRLLADPKARALVAEFHRQWLELDALAQLRKDPALHPEFDDGLRQALLAQVQRYVEYAYFEGEGDLAQLLTSEETFVSPVLSAVYPDLARPPSDAHGSAPTRVGLLGLPALLAIHAHPNVSSPTRRGRFIREQLLCQPIAPPPNDVAASLPSADGLLTTRERITALTAAPTCRSCHALMDDVGFALEAFDALGRVRSADAGKPIDARGELIGTDVDAVVDGEVALSRELAHSRDVRACLLSQWFRFAMGRAPDARDARSLEQLEAYVDAHGGGLSSMLRGIAHTDSFRYRSSHAPAEEP